MGTSDMMRICIFMNNMACGWNLKNTLRSPLRYHQIIWNHYASSQSSTTVSLLPASPSYLSLTLPPSKCSSPWTYVVLDLRAECSNDTSYCISGLWLGGIELLRTSTPKLTTSKLRDIWKVRKDITRYASLYEQTNLNLTMKFHTIVNSVSNGVCNVYATLLFHKNSFITVPLDSKGLKLPVSSDQQETSDMASVIERALDFYDTPSDLIIPISNDGDNGFWFRMKNELDLLSKQILIHKIPVGLFWNFMFHFMDMMSNDAYREVLVPIDRSSLGSEPPFPVVFASEINPLFWKPIVAIGAFNLHSYDFEVTPFLEKVLDGKVHEFGVGVGNAVPHWLVDANFHLWLDKGSSRVTSGTLVAHNPSLSLERHEEFKQLDGSFEIKGKGRNESKGWVISSAGNLTTLILQQFKFKSFIRFEKNGTCRFVKLKIKVYKEVQVLNDRGELLNRIIVRRKCPLSMITSTLSGRIVANVSHAFEERCSNGNYLSSYIYNNQISNGWMPIVEQH
ncbi:Peptide-N4-(N-acetyl-beta-glucosaminyl)asparagine amidase A, putative [Ricinus communis]|uniref:Peptide-N4-(N-acetyl-beta-glucosaminyl)asparagine amidase A, putative n=1 Tax=Ricinus communis TaxID=3988 RepID=B9S454_RICCO|nr:Peptide-N4-(N-acetyl-beta-glucosaminyl)asparagine amidase A, putative [Ricinus communis]